MQQWFSNIWPFESQMIFDVWFVLFPSVFSAFSDWMGPLGRFSNLIPRLRILDGLRALSEKHQQCKLIEKSTRLGCFRDFLCWLEASVANVLKATSLVVVIEILRFSCFTEISIQKLNNSLMSKQKVVDPITFQWAEALCRNDWKTTIGRIHSQQFPQFQPVFVSIAMDPSPFSRAIDFKCSYIIKPDCAEGLPIKALHNFRKLFEFVFNLFLMQIFIFIYLLCIATTMKIQILPMAANSKN